MPVPTPAPESRGPRSGDLIVAALPVLWTWLVTVTLVFTVQWGAGLGNPSEGIALSSAALPAALVALAPIRLRHWAMLVVVGLLVGLALADGLYERFFERYLPIGLLGASDQLWAVRDYGAGLFGPGLVLPALVLLLTGAFTLAAARAERTVMPYRWSSLLPFALCMVGAIPSFLFLVPTRDAGDPMTGGFVYSHLLDVRYQVVERLAPDEPAPADWERVLRRTERPPADTAADVWRGRAAGSSLLMIQVEGMNEWLLDAEVGGEPVMPFARALAERGLRFTAIYDDTHEGRSSDSDYLVMASQHPLERGAVSMTRAELDVDALPDLLAARGWATLSAHAHTPSFWNAGLRHERYGFATSLFAAELGEGESFGFGLTDRVFVERARAPIAALPRPWLAWLITLTMHGPHREPADGLATLPLGALAGAPAGNFLLKARHTDDALRALVGSLDADGALADATLVVYGDHTEAHELDEAVVRGFAGLSDAVPAGVAALALDRIALVIVPPVSAGVAAERIATPGTLMDLAPTLLHLLDVPIPRSFLGRPLLPPGERLVAQVAGPALGGGRAWSDGRCWASSAWTPLPAGDCTPLLLRRREQLEVSWLITRHGLGPRLDSLD